jgi:predicted MFS family arabinose efflux permease
VLSLPLVLTITSLPTVPFPMVLLFFALWFILSTGRGVTAQALISNVVEPQKRGSFMSFNSSIQQIGTSIASLLAGLLVVKGNEGEIFHYNWLGYISVAILVLCIVLGFKIFKASDQRSRPAQLVAKITSKLLAK